MVPGGHRVVRARNARCAAARNGDDPGDRGADRGARRVRPRLRVGRRCLLQGGQLRDLRSPLRTASGGGRGAGAERPEGGSARLRALEGDEGGRGHVVGVPLGARQAGLAHRVLGDGREDARPGVPDPRRRSRPRLPPSRKRACTVARRRAPVREDLDAQRPAAVRGREDVQVGGERCVDPGSHCGVGARAGAPLPDDRTLAQAARVLAGGDDRCERAGRDPAQRVAWRGQSRRRLGCLCGRSRRGLQHPCSPCPSPPLGPRRGSRRAAARARDLRAR